MIYYNKLYKFIVGRQVLCLLIIVYVLLSLTDVDLIRLVLAVPRCIAAAVVGRGG